MAGYREKDIMTDSAGRPVQDDHNSLTIGPNGPVLLEDLYLIDKLSHFDRERIPERVVHAKGAGAYGFFRTYKSMGKDTSADFLQSPNQRTKVFVRFSTVIGSKGSADTVRDPRGFAVKFYTNEGIYDIVGNDLPVFFIRDAIKFPDVIHSLKPAPNDNVRNPERFWDFISLTPESTHMITWVYSDRGTIRDYSKIDGFGVNTYVWVNTQGKRTWIKYHWKSLQGLETIDRQEAERLAGADPDIAVRKLHQMIEQGRYPSWQLCIQKMDPEEAARLEFDPLDDTKIWPENCFPLIPVGVMTLNENPANFFADTEQAAFCPGNIVPGIELSADRMLQGRSFSYLDTQRYRLGPNFMQLPVNCPISPVDNNQRDGSMTYYANPEPVNYSPNTLNHNKPYGKSSGMMRQRTICGALERNPIGKTDDYSQAGERFLSMKREEKEHLADNIAVELVCCREDIVRRVLDNFRKASSEFSEMVLEAMKHHTDSKRL